MPLERGNSRRAISDNLKELAASRTKAGRVRNRRPNAKKINLAIALKEARKSSPRRRPRVEDLLRS